MSARDWHSWRDAAWTDHALRRWRERGLRGMDPQLAWVHTRYLGHWNSFYGWALEGEDVDIVFVAVEQGWTAIRWRVVSVWPRTWWDQRVVRWQRQERRQIEGGKTDREDKSEQSHAAGR